MSDFVVSLPSPKQKYAALVLVVSSHLLAIWLLVYLHQPYRISTPAQVNAIKVRFVSISKSKTVALENAASAEAAPKSIAQPQKEITPVKPVDIEKVKEQPKTITSQQSRKTIVQQPKTEPAIKTQTTAIPAKPVSQSSLDDAQGKAIQGSKQSSQGQGTAQGDAKTAGGTQDGNDKTVSQAQAAPVADDTLIQVNTVDVLSFGKLPYTDKDLQNQSHQVILTIYVDNKGNPTQVQVKHSTGLDYLDQLAVKAAQKARFKPYKVNGQGKSIVVDMPINFEMNRRGR